MSDTPPVPEERLLSADEGEDYKLSYTLRRWYMFLGAAITVLILLMTDPDGGLVQHLPFGATTISWIIQVTRGLFIVSLAHITVSAITSWNPAAEILRLVRKASETSTGAGLAALAMAIILYGLFSVFSIK